MEKQLHTTLLNPSQDPRIYIGEKGEKNAEKQREKTGQE